MKILLPPSEGKTEPTAGSRLDVESLVAPQLHRVREQLVNATVKLSSSRRAHEVLGLGPTQGDLVALNAQLREAPTARADSVYTGVLYEHLEADTLPSERLDDRVLIASALFGLVRPGDHIPAYRLSAGTSLPRLGSVASRWKPVLSRAIGDVAGSELVVDLRSGAYVGLGKVPPSSESATIRVLHEADGKRSVVSHFNKATKGRIVRQLINEDVDSSNAQELASDLRDLGWNVELLANRLDVVVTSL